MWLDCIPSLGETPICFWNVGWRVTRYWLGPDNQGSVVIVCLGASRFVRYRHINHNHKCLGIHWYNPGHYATPSFSFMHSQVVVTAVIFVNMEKKD